MSNAAFTKLMIAQGLKRLLKTTSFVNVSVGDIARECKISRNTFYYHFKDKYDLISWIFYTEITSILSDDISLGHWRDSLLSLCKYMQENRDFYLNVLEFQGQNSFSECLMDFYQAWWPTCSSMLTASPPCLRSRSGWSPAFTPTASPACCWTGRTTA
ncbi:MAG: TetR family transcriptional regulator [Oscillospiraceae bacterium]